jgi:DNA-binding IclR family transcriptional regulator
MGYKSNVKLVQSVNHALQLFEVFRTADKKEEFGVTELSKTLGLHKNNVFRLLATLESRGYI